MRSAFACCVATLGLVPTAASDDALEHALAPDGTRVRCETTKGTFELEVNPSWAPLGASRFLELVQKGYFTDNALYRTVDNFLVQFGTHGDPANYREWEDATIKDDPRVGRPFHKGSLSFAGSGPDTRSVDMFIGISEDPRQLAHWGTETWETPFGGVVEGMDVVDSFFSGYGDFRDGSEGNAKGVDMQRFFNEGNSYLRSDFPEMDYIRSCALTGNVVEGDHVEIVADNHASSEL